MAFKLDFFVADGVRFKGPESLRGTQRLIFGISGTTADVALDVGDLDGTFWADAVANTSTGEAAAAARADLRRLYPNFLAHSNSRVDALEGRIQAAATSGAAYTKALNATTKLPAYAFAASNGITSGTLVVEMLLKPSQEPLVKSYHLGGI